MPTQWICTTTDASTTTCNVTASTPTLGYEDALFIACVIIFFLSLMTWRFLVPTKN